MDEEQGSRSIGSLTKTIATTPGGSDSIPNERPKSSGSTGIPYQEQRVVSLIGRKRSVAVVSSSEIRAALASQDSERVALAALGYLKQPEMSWLKFEHDSEWEVTGFKTTGPIPSEKLPALRKLADLVNQRSDPAEVAKHAGRCLTVTKSRERDSADVKAMLAVLADELAEFPADVVATAFRKWACREIWWPSLAEIRDQCQRETRWRRALHKLVA